MAQIGCWVQGARSSRREVATGWVDLWDGRLGDRGLGLGLCLGLDHQDGPEVDRGRAGVVGWLRLGWWDARPYLGGFFFVRASRCSCGPARGGQWKEGQWWRRWVCPGALQQGCVQQWTCLSGSSS